ncbi:hypothetical protein MHBO_005283 [Bonamia ostreae]|uniref:Uncharacterized protein n=1 Tax=Bonamia ostreae TaxID=126728 RepID=A0ABV2AEM1_9EUKA
MNCFAVFRKRGIDTQIPWNRFIGATRLVLSKTKKTCTIYVINIDWFAFGVEQVATFAGKANSSFSRSGHPVYGRKQILLQTANGDFLSIFKNAIGNFAKLFPDEYFFVVNFAFVTGIEVVEFSHLVFVCVLKYINQRILVYPS